MTATDVRTAEITEYLAAVRAALADLDPATRDQCDLHLAGVVCGVRHLESLTC